MNESLSPCCISTSRNLRALFGSTNWFCVGRKCRLCLLGTSSVHHEAEGASDRQDNEGEGAQATWTEGWRRRGRISGKQRPVRDATDTSSSGSRSFLRNPGRLRHLLAVVQDRGHAVLCCWGAHGPAGCTPMTPGQGTDPESPGERDPPRTTRPASLPQSGRLTCFRDRIAA